MNPVNVDGYHAKINYDEETDQFRGEILGPSGGADFYGSSPEVLR
jgi:predicted HicB family RNase H-like nuclease